MASLAEGTPEPSMDSTKASMASEARAMNDSEGKDISGDIVLEDISIDLALVKLKSLIKEDIETKAHDDLWKLEALHLGKKGTINEKHTRDDFLLAFLRWCQKDPDVEARRYNVSKAFRRALKFATWGYDKYEKYLKEPILKSKVAEIECCFSEPGGSIICPWTLDATSKTRPWVLDCKKMDIPGQPTDEQVYLWLWYYACLLTFDPVAQQPGMCIIEDFKGVGLTSFMKINGKFSSTQKELNKMFYGGTPIRMRSIVMVDSPWWVSMLLGFMRLFISKKMSERIKNLSQADMLTHVGGASFLPEGYRGGTRPLSEGSSVSTGDNIAEEEKHV